MHLNMPYFTYSVTIHYHFCGFMFDLWDILKCIAGVSMRKDIKLSETEQRVQKYTPTQSWMIFSEGGRTTQKRKGSHPHRWPQRNEREAGHCGACL